MRLAFVLKTIVAGIAGVLLGLVATILSLDPGAHGTLTGPWRGAQRDGTFEVDPYSLATIARSGLLPPGSAEGLSFVAATDSAGARLDAGCDYAVGGPVPSTRYWSLGVANPEGFPIANAANRYSLTSAEILRREQEPMSITVATQAREGNWLPVGAPGRFVLVLRLYDTALSAAGAHVAAGAMPHIDKVRCGS